MEDFDLSDSHIKQLGDDLSDHNAELALGNIASRWLTGNTNSNRPSETAAMTDFSRQTSGSRESAGGGSLSRHGSHREVMEMRLSQRNSSRRTGSGRSVRESKKQQQEQQKQQQKQKQEPRSSILGLQMFMQRGGATDQSENLIDPEFHDQRVKEQGPRRPRSPRRTTSAPRVEPRASILDRFSSRGSSSGSSQKRSSRGSIKGIQMLFSDLMDQSAGNQSIDGRRSDASALANLAEIAMNEIDMDDSSKKWNGSETNVKDKSNQFGSWGVCWAYLLLVAIVGAILVLTMPQIDAFRIHNKPSNEITTTESPTIEGHGQITEIIEGQGQITEPPQDEASTITTEEPAQPTTTEEPSKEKETETFQAIPEEEPFEEDEKHEQESFQAFLEEELVPEARHRLEGLQSLLLREHLTPESELVTAGTAANRALQWLALEDPAKLPIAFTPNLPERYALAVLYFSQKDPTGMEEDMSSIGFEAGVGGPAVITKEAQVVQTNKQADLTNQTFLDSTWLSEKSICEWHGVFCDHETVIQLVLTRTGLGGTIPPEILSRTALPHMKHLDLGHNQLRGSLPANLASNPKLELLLLGHNNLTGTIPSNVFQTLPSLRELVLNHNNFTGPLPQPPTKDSPLEVLSFSYNDLDGTIPESYGRHLDSLKQLSLHDNQGIHGNVPSELGLIGLQGLRLHATSLTGEMPQAICDAHADGPLSYLSTDCAPDGDMTKFVCDCCSHCF